MPGRKPKPTMLKLLQGNPGKRPLNEDEPQPKRGIPTMPKKLKPFPFAVKEWKAEAKILDNMGVMTEADARALAERAYISYKLQKLALDIEVEGDTVETYGINRDGEEFLLSSKTNPKVVQQKALLSEYRQYGSLLGLDPSSRSKLKADNPKKKSKAQLFRDRKAG